MDKTCKTCKHWAKIDANLVEDIKKYDNLPSDTMGECQAITNKYSPIAWMCETEVYYIHEGTNDPVFITGPDFGCMLWN